MKQIVDSKLDLIQQYRQRLLAIPEQLMGVFGCTEVVNKSSDEWLCHQSQQKSPLDTQVSHLNDTTSSV